MDKKQFAQVKELFTRVCDLSPDERRVALLAQTDDVEVIDEIMALLSQGELRTTRFSQPVAGALAAIAYVPLQSGDVLGAWTLTDEIGQGGMGKVFFARRSDGHFEQSAAIKLLVGLASQRALEYLARERQILASLSHPNIARLLDGGTTADGQPYLVMEYVDGLPIDEYCRQHQLSRPAILKLFMVVCAAVAFAHQRLVVHCDLKPSNILVTPEGRPILLDFGVSRLISAASVVESDLPVETTGDQTLTGAAFTPRYASPEQKAHGDIGTGSDVYSLGLMLCELMGVPLSSPLSPELMLMSHEIDSDMAAIIIRATALLPADRYSSANALAHDLQRFLDHQPVVAKPQAWHYILGKLLRRQWPLALAATALMVTVTAFSWRAVVERDKALNAERAAREVKDYIISVFQGADPEVSGQRDLLVSALLDKGRDELPQRLKDQPKIRVEMIGILAGVYQKIGKREQSIKMIDEAIVLERPHNRPQVLTDLLFKKAYAMYDAEDFVRAIPLFRDVLARLEGIDPGGASLIDTLRFLALSHAYLGDAESAQPYIDRALALAKNHFGEESVEIGRVHSDAGRHYAMIDGGWRKGEPHSRKAVAIFEKKFGRDHYLTVDALEVLTLPLRANGRYAEGILLAREVSEKRTKLYGEWSNQNGFGLYSYATMLSRAGHNLEAREIFSRCVTIQEKLDGRATLATMVPLFSQAQTSERVGDWDAALALATEVLATYQKLSPENLAEIHSTQMVAGSVLRKLGRLNEAERSTAGLLAEREKKAGSSAWISAQTKIELAAVYRLQHKFDASHRLLASVKDLPMSQLADRRATIIAETARVIQAEGNLAAAMPLFIEAETLLTNAEGVNHSSVWLLKMDRAELLTKLGRRDEARALAREIAMNVKVAIDPKGHIARRLTKLQA